MSVLLNAGENWQMVFSASFTGLNAYSKTELPSNFPPGRYLLYVLENPFSGYLLAGYFHIMPILDGSLTGALAQVGDSHRVLLNNYFFFRSDDAFRVVFYNRPGLLNLSFQVWQAIL